MVDGKTRRVAITSYPMGPTLVKDYPEVEAAVRFLKRDKRQMVQHGDKSFYEDQFLYADANIFDVFTFPLVKGNPKTALREPYTIVLTERAAEKYFGLEDPMGQMLIVDNELEFKITGVLKNIPHNVHYRFDFLTFTCYSPRFPGISGLLGKPGGFLSGFSSHVFAISSKRFA